MQKPDQSPPLLNSSSRRKFLKTAAAFAGGPLLWTSKSKAAPGDELRLGLIGCGGRGTGAASQALSARRQVRLYAMGDLFEDRIKSSSSLLRDKHGSQMEVPAERMFIGWEAYAKVLEEVDAVILAAPTAFRPCHFEAAVLAGKHCFLEKGFAVDAPGIRRMMEADRMAREKGLKCVPGVNRRYDPAYAAARAKVQEGAIGTVKSAQAVWRGSTAFLRKAEPGLSPLQNQVKNWINHTWCSGDSIVEWGVHVLDAALMVLGFLDSDDKTDAAVPLLPFWASSKTDVDCSATGTTQRIDRLSDAGYGDLMDEFVADFALPGGVPLRLETASVSGRRNLVTVELTGSKGILSFAKVDPVITDSAGQIIWKYRRDAGDSGNPYELEQKDFIRCIFENAQPAASLHSALESNMACILGRMAAVSGRRVTWDEALKSTEQFCPDKLESTTPAPAQFDKFGNYFCPARPLKA